MSSLPNVVKSVSVVDTRIHVGQQPVQPVVDRPILKGGMAVISRAERQQPVTQDALALELNRLRIEINQAKVELRGLKQKIRDTERLLDSSVDRYEGLEDEDVFFARKQEIRDMVSNAELQASGIVAHARNEAEQLKEQAKSEGYQLGLEHGIQEAIDSYRAENMPVIEELKGMLARLSGFEQQRLQESEQELVELTVAIARKVIGREIGTDGETVLSMLRQVVEDNRREEYIKITVSPDLVPLEMPVSAEIREKIESMAQNIRITVENGDDKGLCLMETPKGITDLSVDTQLENIRQGLAADE